MHLSYALHFVFALHFKPRLTCHSLIRPAIHTFFYSAFAFANRIADRRDIRTIRTLFHHSIHVLGP